MNGLIALLFFFAAILPGESTSAQNIYNDTVYVSTGSTAELIFHSPSGGTLPAADGSYKVSGGSKTSLIVTALRKDAPDQTLNVTEGSRKHRFVLVYKEGIPAQRIDRSNLKKLKAHVEDKKKRADKVLSDARSLLARNSWEAAQVKYRQLLNMVDTTAADAGSLTAGLREVRGQMQEGVEKKYNDAMMAGKQHFDAGRYEESKQAYLKALEYKPGDTLARRNLSFIDRMQVDDFIKRGDEAVLAKNYILAKGIYQEGLNIRPNHVELRSKFAQAAKKADPLIYQEQRNKGDKALQAGDLEVAKQAYNLALSVKPDDAYVKAQLQKLQLRERDLAAETEKDKEYNRILAKAKSLADAASSAQEYDLAINEYRKASVMFPRRQFPKDRINELTKSRKDVSKKSTAGNKGL